MGFLSNKKGTVISDHFKLMEDIASFAKGYMYELALYSDHLEVISLQKRKLSLDYEQVTDVFYGTETELTKKQKSPVGRAVVGGLLFGSTGALVGAMSGIGEKTVKTYHTYLIISYLGSDGKDGYLQFEDTRKYKGNKLQRKLKELCHISNESSEEEVKL